jgi:rare lipoprotein A
MPVEGALTRNAGRRRRNLALALLLILPLGLAACGSSPKGAPRSGAAIGVPESGSYKVGRPYTVGGITYTPREEPTYSETGIASWYGPNFHGKRTANGEVFDRNLLTAAHRTLPMPSAVRVTNLDNGRSVIVRVNDRGPFARGRIIDLSEAAAEQLGYRNNGVAKVRVEGLGEESRLLKQAAERGAGPRSRTGSCAVTSPRPGRRAACG